MHRMLQRMAASDRGFTLIELLVVVAILGILSSVVVLNIGSFLRTGTVEAANTEVHQVQTAVVAYIVASGGSTWTGSVGPADAGASGHPAEYLLNPGSLQATYEVEGGVITGASKIASSRWGEAEFVDGLWALS